MLKQCMLFFIGKYKVSKELNMFRKKKETQFEDSPMKKEEDQILTRSRVRELNNNSKRNTWLNKAIIIVAILLAITIFAVFRL